MKIASGRVNLSCMASILRPLQQLRQLGDVASDATRLIAREPLHRHAATLPVFEIDIGDRLTIGVADAEAFGGLVDGRRLWRSGIVHLKSKRA